MHHGLDIGCALHRSENGWNLPIFLFISRGTPLAEV